MLILIGQSGVFMQNKQCLYAILFNLTLRKKTNQNKNCLERKGGNNNNLIRRQLKGEKEKKSILLLLSNM